MKYLEGSADKLRAAERQAKEKKLRKWQKYQHTGPEVLINTFYYTETNLYLLKYCFIVFLK